MKVVPPKNNGNGNGGSIPRPAILPLQHEEEEQVPKHLLRTFDLLTDVADNDSPKYRVYARILDGTESARITIKWRLEAEKIVTGLGVANLKNRSTIIQELATGAALSAHNGGIRLALTKEKLKQAKEAEEAEGRRIGDVDPADARAVERKAARMAAAKQAVVDKAQNHVDFYTEEVIIEGLNTVVGHALPLKALQQVKRYLRRDCRKPVGMKVRDYFTHLNRINTEEIPYLPPYGGQTQALSDDEISDILLFGVPKSWIREMDRQGKDPVYMTTVDLVLFLEQIELAEDYAPGQQSNGNNNNKSKKGKKGKSNQKGGSNNDKGGDGDYYCIMHGNNNTHSTDDCRTIKQQVKKMKNKHSSGGNSNSNNDWKNKAKNNKNKASKELNAVAKKAAQESAKAVVKELNATNKKRKSADESDDDNSVNALEKELFAVDLGKISDHSDDDVSC